MEPSAVFPGKTGCAHSQQGKSRQTNGLISATPLILEETLTRVMNQVRAVMLIPCNTHGLVFWLALKVIFTLGV